MESDVFTGKAVECGAAAVWPGLQPRPALDHTDRRVHALRQVSMYAYVSSLQAQLTRTQRMAMSRRLCLQWQTAMHVRL